MRRRFPVVFCSVLLVLVAVASNASAQTDVFVTPIPNAPFSAVINVERSFVQRDGSVVERKTIREVGRDARGRIFNEYRQLLPPSSTETPQVTHVLVYDPQTRFSTTLFPQQRTFRKGIVNRPPATVPPALTSASTTGGSLPQNQFTKKKTWAPMRSKGFRRMECDRPRPSPPRIMPRVKRSWLRMNPGTPRISASIW